MDELPRELQDNILARLPVVQLFQMQTVCRRFRGLTESPSFVNSWTAMAAPEHWLLMFHEQFGAPGMFMQAYDPRGRRWYNLPLQRPFFCLKPHHNEWLDGALASAHGLVCFPPNHKQVSLWDIHVESLVIWNPLANMSRELPGMLIKGKAHVGIVVDAATKAFVVVAVGVTVELLRITEVYDSAVGVWNPMHTSFVEWRGRNFFGPLVHCNGCFHMIAETVMETGLCVISYNVKQGVWKETCRLPVTGNPSKASPSLFEVTPGRLFLAERTQQRWGSYVIHLWEMSKQLEDNGDSAAVEWIQVAAVPQAIIMEAGPSIGGESWAGFHFDCKAVGNLVCFNLIGTSNSCGFAYDVTRDAWHSMPRRGWRRVSHVVSFEPRLDMLSA